MDFIMMEGDFPFWRGFLVEQWKRLPHRTLLLSLAPSLWRAGDYDRTEALPYADGRLAHERLAALAAQFGTVAGACTVFEPAVGLTLEVQRALGLPELSRGAPRSLRNKAAMVDVVRSAGLAVPATVSGTDAPTVVREAAASLPLPVVVKPAELAGKAGVCLVREAGDLLPAVEAALAETLAFEIDGRPTSVVEIFGCERGVLVQEFIRGPEFSVEGYASRGAVTILAITEKLETGPPLFEEIGHLQPARLDAAQDAQVREYAIAVARAFQLEHCAFHLELRLSPSGPVLMEINCRIAGDMIARLLELRSGLVTGDLLLRLAAGAEAPAPPRWVGSAGIRMITVPVGGSVRALTPPVIRSDREFAVFEAGVGSAVHAPKPGGGTRVGYLMVAGADREAVEGRLEELARETVVEVDEDASQTPHA